MSRLLSRSVSLSLAFFFSCPCHSNTYRYSLSFCCCCQQPSFGSAFVEEGTRQDIAFIMYPYILTRRRYVLHPRAIKSVTLEDSEGLSILVASSYVSSDFIFIDRFVRCSFDHSLELVSNCHLTDSLLRTTVSTYDPEVPSFLHPRGSILVI